MIFAMVNAFHAANQIFDDTLNALHPMALAAEQDNNQSYTFHSRPDIPRVTFWAPEIDTLANKIAMKYFRSRIQAKWKNAKR